MKKLLFTVLFALSFAAGAGQASADPGTTDMTGVTWESTGITWEEASAGVTWE